MTVQVTDLVAPLQTLFGKAADLAARQALLIRRQRKLTPAAFAQGLVFALLDNPHACTDELVLSLARAGGLLARFPGVYLLDGTSVALPAALADSWPGCGGRGSAAAPAAALKIVVRYEVGGGRIEGLAFQPGRSGDANSPLQRHR